MTSLGVSHIVEARKICPYCEVEGAKSRLYDHGGYVTLMAVSNYYDEDGLYVVDDPNIRTHNFTCSRGHKFSESNQRGIITRQLRD